MSVRFPSPSLGDSGSIQKTFGLGEPFACPRLEAGRKRFFADGGAPGWDDMSEGGVFTTDITSFQIPINLSAGDRVETVEPLVQM